MTAIVVLEAVVAADLSFESLFRDHARDIAAVVAVSTGDPALAEDATQEAMLRAFSSWRRVSQLERPDMWVLRVAANLAIDAWRRRRREVPLPSDDGTSAPDDIRAVWLRWDLERLTPEDRLLLILRHRDGLGVDEMAVLLGRSPHTIKSYLKRARRRLRALLGEVP